MKTFEPNQVIRFTAERGGVDREYEVTLIQACSYDPNGRHWVADYKGKSVTLVLYKDEDFVIKMWTFRGTGVTTICRDGIIQ